MPNTRRARPNVSKLEAQRADVHARLQGVIGLIHTVLESRKNLEYFSKISGKEIITVSQMDAEAFTRAWAIENRLGKGVHLGTLLAGSDDRIRDDFGTWFEWYKRELTKPERHQQRTERLAKRPAYDPKAFERQEALSKLLGAQAARMLLGYRGPTRRKPFSELARWGRAGTVDRLVLNDLVQSALAKTLQSYPRLFDEYEYIDNTLVPTKEAIRYIRATVRIMGEEIHNSPHLKERVSSEAIERRPWAIVEGRTYGRSLFDVIQALSLTDASVRDRLAILADVPAFAKRSGQSIAQARTQAATIVTELGELAHQVLQAEATADMDELVGALGAGVSAFSPGDGYYD